MDFNPLRRRRNGRESHKIIGDRAFLDHLKTVALKYPGEIILGDEVPEADPQRLGFGLIEIAAVITIISGTMQIAKLSMEFAEGLRKTRSKKVVLQRPDDVLHISATEPLAASELRQFLGRVDDTDEQQPADRDRP